MAPRCSRVFGPGGTPAVGAAPRLAGTKSHSSDPPSPTHWHGGSHAAVNGAVVTDFACPDPVSAIHSSMLVSRCCVNAKRLPSGEKPIHASDGDGGSVT